MSNNVNTATTAATATATTTAATATATTIIISDPRVVAMCEGMTQAQITCALEMGLAALKVYDMSKPTVLSTLPLSALPLSSALPSPSPLSALPSLPSPSPLSSSKLGALGEEKVMTMLSLKFGNHAVTRVSGESRSGDIKLSLPSGIKISVEVKNYTRVVGSAEVTKFYRDLECVNVDAGIFISLQTGISGQPATFQIRSENVGGYAIPVIFISGREGLLDDYMRDLIYYCVDIVHELVKVRRSLDDQSSITQQISEDLSTTAEALSKHRHVWGQYLGEFIDACTKFSGSIQSADHDIRKYVKKIRGLTCHTTTNMCHIEAEIRHYPDDTREKIMEIYNAINRDVEGLPDVWKIGQRKLIHVRSGIILGLFKGYVDVTIPRHLVSDSDIVRVVNASGCVDSNGATLPINSANIDLIKKLLC